MNSTAQGVMPSRASSKKRPAGLRLDLSPLASSVHTSPITNDSRRNLYVLGIPQEMTLDEFTGLFSPFGKVSHAVILAVLDAFSRRRGFVVMLKNGDAVTAMRQMSGAIIRGSKLHVSWAVVQRSNGFLDGTDRSFHTRSLTSPTSPVASIPSQQNQVPLEPRPFTTSSHSQTPTTPHAPHPHPSSYTLLLTNLHSEIFKDTDDISPLLVPFGSLRSIKMISMEAARAFTGPYSRETVNPAQKPLSPTHQGLAALAEFTDMSDAFSAKAALAGQTYDGGLTQICAQVLYNGGESALKGVKGEMGNTIVEPRADDGGEEFTAAYERFEMRKRRERREMGQRWGMRSHNSRSLGPSNPAAPPHAESHSLPGPWIEPGTQLPPYGSHFSHPPAYHQGTSLPPYSTLYHHHPASPYGSLPYPFPVFFHTHPPVPAQYPVSPNGSSRLIAKGVSKNALPMPFDRELPSPTHYFHSSPFPPNDAQFSVNTADNRATNTIAGNVGGYDRRPSYTAELDGTTTQNSKLKTEGQQRINSGVSNTADSLLPSRLGDSSAAANEPDSVRNTDTSKNNTTNDSNISTTHSSASLFHLTR